MNQEPPRRRYHANQHRMLAGVAGGIAEYVHIDPTRARVLLVRALLPSGPFGLVAYAILAVLILPVPTVGSPR